MDGSVDPLPAAFIQNDAQKFTLVFFFFLADEDFGSEDDDVGADDGKADSDYESSQKSKKGKKAKPDKNKRAASKSRKRPAGKKKKKFKNPKQAVVILRFKIFEFCWVSEEGVELFSQ